MKRKIKRKLWYLAMSLVIIISLSFSACNSNNTQDNSLSQTKQSESKFAGGS